MAERIYEVEVRVVEVRGNCATGYLPSSKFRINGFYIDPRGMRNEDLYSCINSYDAFIITIHT